MVALVQKYTNAPLILIVFDVIQYFCMLAKHINGNFARFSRWPQFF
jgi:hypothetical protein